MSTAKLIRFHDDGNEYALSFSKEEATAVLYYIVGNSTKEHLLEHIGRCNPHLSHEQCKHLYNVVSDMFTSIMDFNKVYETELVEDPDGY